MMVEYNNKANYTKKEKYVCIVWTMKKITTAIETEYLQAKVVNITSLGLYRNTKERKL